MIVEQTNSAREKGDEIIAKASAKTEQFRPFEKKRPFFGKKQWEPGQVSLPRVHFRLGKIRIDGQVAADVAAEVPDQVAAAQAVSPHDTAYQLS